MSNWWMSQRAGSLWGETLDFESIEGRALLIMFEVVNDSLDPHEKTQISEKLKRLLGRTQQPALRARVEKCIAQVEEPSDETYD